MHWCLPDARVPPAMGCSLTTPARSFAQLLCPSPMRPPPPCLCVLGAQALVAWALRRADPATPLSLVAEEDSASLRWACFLPCMGCVCVCGCGCGGGCGFGVAWLVGTECPGGGHPQVEVCCGAGHTTCAQVLQGGSAQSPALSCAVCQSTLPSYPSMCVC
jgi:hypothetical protein